MKDIVVATTTRYENLDDVRLELAAKMISRAISRNLQIVVVDESREDIKDIFRKLGALVLFSEKEGMGASRRQAIQEATKLAGSEGLVVWTEPEKAPLISLLKEIFPHFESKPDLDLIVPGRGSLESYPLFQQYFEWLTNRAFEIISGLPLDVSFGPRVFRTRVSPFFLEYDGDKWDSIFVPVLRMIKAGRVVMGLGVDYTYPEEQTRAEENDPAMFWKRLEQLETIVSALQKEAESLGP